MPSTNFELLMEQWERVSDDLPEHLGLRMRGALSWLGRAERETANGDDDAAFIFYWIAFNAAYARDRPGFLTRRSVTS